MNRADVINLAKKAGATEWCPGWHLWTDELCRFAALVAASEREECAKTAWSSPEPEDEYVPLRQAIADSIRARGQA